jgi:hypothetical protein
MEKTAKEMTSDILSSLRDQDNPLGILIEGYLEQCLKMAKKEARKEVLEHIKTHDVDEKGNIKECNLHFLYNMLTK